MLSSALLCERHPFSLPDPSSGDADHGGAEPDDLYHDEHAQQDRGQAGGLLGLLEVRDLGRNVLIHLLLVNCPAS